MAVARLAADATDPSVDGGLVAWHEPGSRGVLVRDGTGARVAGAHPAVGGGWLAMLGDGTIEVQATATGGPPPLSVAAPNADAVAVSGAWVAWRSRVLDEDSILAAPLAGGPARTIASGAELGRPSLDGDRLAFHAAGRILLADLATGRTTTLRRERRAQLLNPSLLDGWLVYVRAIYRRQEVRLGPATRRAPRRDERLWETVPTGRRDRGHEPGVRHHRHGHPRKLWPRPGPGMAATLWTTALAPDAAYVTRLRQRAGTPPSAEILRVTR